MSEEREIGNDYIVFDTNSFGNTKRYNFVNGKIPLSLHSLSGNSNIKIIMPSIVLEEIKKHIRDSLKVSTINSDFRYLKEYLENQIDGDIYEEAYEYKIKELNKFIKDNKIKILDCNKYTDVKQINDWYFNLKPPFEISKKSEFPDAMIISSVINYFKDVKKNDTVYVISEDKGLKKGIEVVLR